jgi:hypothetical protein
MGASPQWFVDVMQVQECTSEAARDVMRVLKFAGVGAVALPAALLFLIPGRHRIGGSTIDLATAAPNAG